MGPAYAPISKVDAATDPKHRSPSPPEDLSGPIFGEVWRGAAPTDSRLQAAPPSEDLSGPYFDDIDLGHLKRGILRESDPNRRRLVLWVKEKDETWQALWLRVSSWGPLREHLDGEVFFAPAIITMFRQRLPTLYWDILSSLRLLAGHSYVLPTGKKVERIDEAQSKGLVIMSKEGSLDTSVVARLWAGNSGIRKLSEKLALAEGVGEQ